MVDVTKTLKYHFVFLVILRRSFYYVFLCSFIALWSSQKERFWLMTLHLFVSSNLREPGNRVGVRIEGEKEEQETGNQSIH